LQNDDHRGRGQCAFTVGIPIILNIQIHSDSCVRLLNNNAARSSENVTEPEVPSQDFFREILLSYRVIFGQDERSWKAFSRIVPAWEDRVDLSSNPSWESSWDCDPLLHVLCGRSVETPEARQVYEEVDANEPTSNYIPHADFKFFGKRLLDLQDFIDQHQPRNVRGLLNDRRDVAAWYTLWNNQVCNQIQRW
jgi:hypothetical protein